MKGLVVKKALITGITGQDGAYLAGRLQKPYLGNLEAHSLVGDASKAKEAFGWEPKVKFAELVKLMMQADLIAEDVAVTH